MRQALQSLEVRPSRSNALRKVTGNFQSRRTLGPCTLKIRRATKFQGVAALYVLVKDDEPKSEDTGLEAEFYF